MTVARSHDSGGRCGCVAEHRPPILELEWHHIWPKGMGGPDTPVGVEGQNGIWICNNTHSNTHELLRLMVRADRALSYSECQGLEDRPVSRYAHALAVRGFHAYKGEPGQ